MQRLTPRKLGYWHTHDYTRRAVSRDVRLGIGDLASGFVGWIPLLQLCQQLNASTHQRDRALFATAFLTGGRISEVLALRPHNFTVDADEVLIKGMSLLKRYKKLEAFQEWIDVLPDNRLKALFKWDAEQERYWRTRYATMKLEEERDPFSIPRNEPLCDLMVDWVQSHYDYTYLFPGYRRKALSYIRVYQLFREVTLGYEDVKDNTEPQRVHLYPHWLRAQRASCLISFYNLRMEAMMQFLGWEEIETARNYARFGIKRLTAMMQGKAFPPGIDQLQQQLAN
jgi:integrase